MDLCLSIPSIADFIQFIQNIRQPSMLATFQRTHPLIKFGTTLRLYPAYRPAAVLRLTFWLFAADNYIVMHALGNTTFKHKYDSGVTHACRTSITTIHCLAVLNMLNIFATETVRTTFKFA